MPYQLPRDVWVESLGAAGVRYVLPRQPAVRLGLALMPAGLAVPVFPLLIGVLAWRDMGAVALPFAIVDLVFVAAFWHGLGKLVFFMGLCLALGHAEIEILDGKLCAIYQCGAWRRQWSRPIKQVSELRVASGFGKRRSKWWLGDVATIRTGADSSEIWLALGYPRATCEVLAEALRVQIEAVASRGVIIETEPLLAEVPPAGPSFVERHVQPTGSKVLLTRLSNGVTLTAPPLGMRGGTWAFILFGASLTALLLFAGIHYSLARHRLADVLYVWSMLSIFLLIGFGSIAVGVIGARLCARLEVVNGELRFLQTGFRRVEHRWRAGEVASIAVGRSGRTVNDQPIMELQVTDIHGVTCGVCPVSDTAELEWIATVLRDALVGTNRASLPGLHGAIDVLSDVRHGSA